MIGIVSILKWSAQTFAIFKIASWAFGKFRGNEEQGDYVFTNKKKEQTKIRTQKRANQNLEVQNTLASQVAERAQHIRTNNQYHFVLYKGKKNEEKKPFYNGNLLVIHNNVAILPRHLLNAWLETFLDDKDGIIEFSSIKKDPLGDSNIKVRVPIANFFVDSPGGPYVVGGAFDVGQDFFPLPGRQCTPDLAMIRVPLTGKDITKWFMTSEELVTANKSNHGILSALERDALGTQLHGKFVFLENASHVHTDGPAQYDPGTGERVYGDEVEWFSNNMVEYNLNTKKGNCGSPFFSTVGGHPRIISVHVAGVPTQSIGYGVIPLREDIIASMKELVRNNIGSKNQITVDTMEIQGMMSEANFEEANGDYAGHNIIGKVKGHILPSATSLVKSPLYEVFEPFVKHKMEPAALSPFKNDTGDLIYPMRVAQSGYGHGGTYGNKELMKYATESVWMSIATACHPEPYEKSKPNWETVVSPGPGWECTRSIQRGTSPGYPYCLKYKKGKKDFFGFGDDFDFSSEEAKLIFAEAEALEASYSRGERPLITCMSFLKDERRPIDRVRNGKTRLISASGLAFTLVCRKYTMGFVNYLTRGRVVNGMAIGINPFSDEWTSLAARHTTDLS